MIRFSMVVLWFFLLQALPCGGAVIVFQAELTPDQVEPLGENAAPLGSPATGFAEMFLDLDSAEISMRYSIALLGLSIADDVTAVHFHLGHSAEQLSARVPRHGEFGVNGPHALNVYGMPRQDDLDLVVDLGANTLSGIWDNGDRNFGGDGTYDPSDSLALGDLVLDLLAEEVYIQVHTKAFPGGEIRGQLRQIPEPTVAFLLQLFLSFLTLRRTRPGRTGSETRS